MSGPRLFNRLRNAAAPLLRPILEGVGPVRELGLWWLARRHPESVELDGLRFQVNPRDFGVTLELHSTGDYEPFARNLFVNALGPGMVVLDIGAHVGLYTIPSARAVGDSGRVLAFEPHPGNRGLLERNIATNGLDNITVIPAAVSDREGQLDLHTSRFNTGDHRLYRSGGGEGVPTPVVSIDAACRAEGITGVDLIKIDVQGAELQVLRGMEETLRTSPSVRLVLEYTPWMLEKAGVVPRDLLDWLVSRGFDLSILDETRGVRRPATLDQVMAACPGRSYVNLLAARGEAPGAP